MRTHMYNCQRSTIKIDTGDKNLSLRFLYWQSIYFYPKKLTWTKTNFHLYNQGTYYARIICVLKPKTVEGTFQKKKWTFIILVSGAKCGGIRNWMRQSIDLTTIFTKIWLQSIICFNVCMYIGTWIESCVISNLL